MQQRSLQPNMLSALKIKLEHTAQLISCLCIGVVVMERQRSLDDVERSESGKEEGKLTQSVVFLTN